MLDTVIDRLLQASPATLSPGITLSRTIASSSAVKSSIIFFDIHGQIIL